MNRKLHVGLLVLVLIVSLSVMIGSVTAQRPGGGGARPTRPGSQQGGDGALALTLTALPNTGELAATLTALPNAGDLAATLTAFPTPAAVGTLSALLTSMPQGTLVAPTSSAEAAAAMADFANLYLGFSPNYLYAGVQNASSSADVPENAKAAISAILAQLPADMQAYLTNFSDGSGLVYGGLYQDGSSVMGVANCAANPNCTVSAESLQLYLTTSAAGLYTLYANTGVNNATDALNLLVSVYPKLGSVGLSPAITESGYAFEVTSVDSSVQNQSVQASAIVYYAGVIPAGNLSLTYALVGVGAGYTQIGG
jgi:hypothetical protein